MLIQIIAAGQVAAGEAAGAHEAKFGLVPALKQGGALTWGVFLILVAMFMISLYILFAKLWEQQKIINEGKKVRAAFWNATSLKEAGSKLDKDSAYRQIVDDGIRAQEQTTLLTEPVDAHDWTLMSLARTRAAIDSKLKSGLAFLATTGSTAPFIGLFGTVIGILCALLNTGTAGEASIDTVAGPVGEALIMTAIGLAVAVPAVLAYNWLQSRNKTISENLGTFTNDVHGWMASGGAVKPATTAARLAAKPAVAAKPASAPIKA